MDDAPDRPVVAVAYSGGRDSTALLHATARAALHARIEVAALHVHHGLQAAADDWLRHCRDTTRRWARGGLPLRFFQARIDTAPAAGDSIEAWARRQRYTALRTLALEAGARRVLLAHHRQDQAETFLLQALRGAGPAGLSGMPREVQREGILWLRPWLDRAPADIEAYVRRHRLSWIEDPSNADPAFARSRLRSRLWPQLLQAFPEAEATLSRAATWAQDATTVLQERAREDLAACLAPLHKGIAGPLPGTTPATPGDLRVDDWLRLSPERRSQVLRLWLRDAGRPVNAAILLRLMDELPAAVSGRWDLGEGRALRRHRGLIVQVDVAAAAPMPAGAVDEAQASPEVDGGLGWCAPDTVVRHGVPGHAGHFELRRVETGGVSAARLAGLRLVSRNGGERFSLGPGRPARSLKRQFQALGRAAWLRDGPMLADADGLVYVAGLGLDGRAIAAPGLPQVSIDWHPAARAGSP